MIQIKAALHCRPKKVGMSFNPRRVFNIEVAAIVVIIFSAALICYVLLSFAGIIEFPD